MTPEEAWSGSKPSVHHFRVFGCLAHVHIPDVHRKMLDGKSIKCILLGVSEESKAYKLFEPVEKRIIVSRDVVFEESKGWSWNKKDSNKATDHISDNGDNEQDFELEDDLEEADNGEIDNQGSNHNSDSNNDEIANSDSDDDTPPANLPTRDRRPPSYL
jgi:hypothetical protein